MKLMIEIPEEDYIRLRDEGMFGNVTTFKRAVREGIPLAEQEPCTDAISREDALQALCKAVHKNDDTIPCRNQIVSCLWNKTKVQDYAEEILKLSPVTPVGQKVGHWINPTTMQCMKEQIFYYCSVCGNYADANKYCPNCGAKMQEVKNDT